ncbi:MAG: OmpA family protein [Acidobacteriia bacterium]|nr:OmpA family protein [Terriglobia bacterium]
MHRPRVAFIAVGVALALTLLATACATKKYVQDSVGPLETRLGKAEEGINANSTRITDVDQRAQTGITDAKTQAVSAEKDATAAGQSAQTAQTLAQSSMTEAQRVREELKNSDNFQEIKTQTVLFDFNHSDLTEEAKKQLDEIASLVSSKKRFVIEVQGFTDGTGPADYNLQLSKRRADSVVRYLTLEQKVPLARVFEIGYGEEAPTSPNNTREGREQNRRVQLRVLAASETPTGTQAQTTTPATH